MCRDGRYAQHAPAPEKIMAWKYRPFIGRLNLFLIVTMISLFCACTHNLPPPGTIKALNQKVLSEKIAADVEMMHEGITWMGSPEDQTDYGRARAAFDTLVKTYPASRWRRLSEKLIHLIDTMDAHREKEALLSKSREDGAAMLWENEKLKKDIASLNDKLKVEAAKLTEENDQLKKDIRLLKNLEIELEKRDKTLR